MASLPLVLSRSKEAQSASASGQLFRAPASVKIKKTAVKVVDDKTLSTDTASPNTTHPDDTLAVTEKKITEATRERLTFHPRFLEGAYDEASRTASVIIIEDGMGNRRDKHYYGPDTISQAVMDKVFEGAQAYADHPGLDEDVNRPERSVRDLFGYYYDTKVVEVSRNGQPHTAMAAKLRIQEGADWAIGLIKEAISYNARFPDKVYVGISINADGDVSPDEVAGQTVNYVHKITDAFSADLVTKPARGGRFLALTESAYGARSNGVAMKKTLSESAARLHDKIKSGAGEVDKDELLGLLAGLREAEDPSIMGAKESKADMEESDMEEADKKDKADSEDQADGGDDEMSESAKEAKVCEDMEEAKKPPFMESDVRKQYPSIFNAALTEAQRLVESDTKSTIVSLKKRVAELEAEKSLRESADLVKGKLRESKLPEAAAIRLMPHLIGKSAAEIGSLIEAEAAYLDGIGALSGKRVEGATERTAMRESDVSNTASLFAGMGG